MFAFIKNRLKMKILNGLTSKDFGNFKAVFYSINLLVSIAAILYLLKYTRYGFEFADEGYYLVWLSDPYYYKFSLSLFGYFYNIIFHNNLNNIADLRKLNLIFILIAGTFLSFIFIKSIIRGSKIKVLIISVSFGLLSLLYIAPDRKSVV